MKRSLLQQPATGWRHPFGIVSLLFGLIAGLTACQADGATDDTAPPADTSSPLSDTVDTAADDAASPTPTLAERLCDWSDHPANPLIEPPAPETLIGDPTVLRPEESPDGQWHLFANTLLGIQHYVCADGLAWQRLTPILQKAGAFRPYIFRAEGEYQLFYEQFLSLTQSEIRRIHSGDLQTWSEPAMVLTADLAWEQTRQPTVGNPYVLRRDDEYWLYYSADGVWLEDTEFCEPRAIGLARAAQLAGPWTKDPEPLLLPAADQPYRNLGAGSMKLLDERLDGQWLALNNGIYRDAEGHSRSAIMVLASPDGRRWQDVCGGPVINPGGDGWKRAFVYAFDTIREGDTLRAYYNARDGWKQGVERIGLATLQLPPVLVDPPSAGSE